jgi:hypothetical protein
MKMRSLQRNLMRAGIGLGICVLLLTVGTAGTMKAGKREVDLSAIHGRIQFVNAFPDYKVQVVTALPDLRVKRVKALPNRPGEWQIVDSLPDYKIQIVDALPDFTIQWVDAFPGGVVTIMHGSVPIKTCQKGQNVSSGDDEQPLP